MRNIYFKGSQGAIGVFDLTTPESLLRLPGWISTMKKATGNIPLIIIGNKLDLEEERRVAKEDAVDLARRLNATYYEVSAKMGTQVEEMFTNIARLCYENALKSEQELNDA